MTLYLRRRAAFSAGFRQPPPGETGRGHDYLAELTVGGEIDPETGMVINIKDVDAVLRSQVVGLLHGRLLDEEVPQLRGLLPTLENLVSFCWQQCAPALPAVGRLVRVTLWPTPTLKVELSHLPATLEKPMLTVTRFYDFSASHRLHSLALSDRENAEIFGKCNWENGHGHNYEIEVTLAGDPDARAGQLWDGQRLDKIVTEEILEPYDHKHLNYDTFAFRDLNPTSENLTLVIWNSLSPPLAPRGLKRGAFIPGCGRETARNYFEYYGDTTEERI